MNETKALAVIETEYGSLEEFAYAVLSQPHMRPALDETESILTRAEASGLPVNVFGRIINSAAFRSILRTTIVNRSFGFHDEERHIKEIVSVAVGEDRKVMSPRGEIGLVDQAPGDVIAAGRYLNELRGTSVEQKGGGGGNISIQILNANGEQLEATTSVAVETPAGGHTPRGAGALPPPGVLQRGSRALPGSQSAAAPTDSAVPSRQHPEQPAAQSADALLSGAAAGSSPRAADQEGSIHSETQRRAMSQVEQGMSERRRLWEELPNRPAPGESPKPSRYGD